MKKEQITRRQFLKGALAIPAGLAAMGWNGSDGARTAYSLSVLGSNNEAGWHFHRGNCVCPARTGYPSSSQGNSLCWLWLLFRIPRSEAS